VNIGLTGANPRTFPGRGVGHDDAARDAVHVPLQHFPVTEEPDHCRLAFVNKLERSIPCDETVFQADENVLKQSRSMAPMIKHGGCVMLARRMG
jgi:hypothetical protein